MCINSNHFDYFLLNKSPEAILQKFTSFFRYVTFSLLYFWKLILIRFISIVRALRMSKINSENTTNIFNLNVRLPLKRYWVVYIKIHKIFLKFWQRVLKFTVLINEIFPTVPGSLLFSELNFHFKPMIWWNPLDDSFHLQYWIYSFNSF